MSSETSEGGSSGGSQGSGVNNVDTASPYYIHASDNPGHVFTADLLHDSNFGEWVNDMTEALHIKNKICFVDGTLPQPDIGLPDHAKWLRTDAMVKRWLKSAMEKEVRSSVRFAQTAQEIWADISERFGKGSAPRAYELRRAISQLRQDGSSVSAYYTRLKGLWDEVQAIRPLPKFVCPNSACQLRAEIVAIRAKEQLYIFLMGLDDVFAPVRTQILATKPLPDFRRAYHIFAEDEQQRNITNARRPTNEPDILSRIVSGDFEQEALLVAPLFIAMVLESMIITKVAHVTEEKLRQWWGYLNWLKQAGFNVQFMFDHLKRVTRAYFGLRARILVAEKQIELDRIAKEMDQLKMRAQVVKNQRDAHLMSMREPAAEFVKQCLIDSRSMRWKPTILGLDGISLEVLDSDGGPSSS